MLYVSGLLANSCSDMHWLTTDFFFYDSDVAYLVTRRVVFEALEAFFLLTSSSNSFRLFPLLISLSSSA